MIRHLSHNEIDKNKWDHCIEICNNKLPYAFSWWLDIVSPCWDALIEGDYEAVMPLTWKKKLGIYYLFQPFFSQQLGIFSKQIINASKTVQFLKIIPPKFKLIDIQLNGFNDPFEYKFRYRLRNNYMLDLSDPYEKLSLRYNRSCQRNLLKASRYPLFFGSGPRPAVFKHFIERNLDMKLQGINRTIYHLLEQVCNASLLNSTGIISGVYDSKGELLACQWLLQQAQRCVLLVCASTETGRKMHAMYYLIDQIIRQNAGKKVILDFSGSDIPGVAYFNSSFGAIKTSYPAIFYNNLPWPVKLFKK